MRYAHYFRQGRLRATALNVEHGGRTVGYRAFDLPGFGIADTRACVAIRQPHLNQLCAAGPHGVIVEVTLAAHHDHFILHAARIGQPAHLAGIQSGYAMQAAVPSNKPAAAPEVTIPASAPVTSAITLL